LAETIGEETVITDALEAGRQGVEEKAADELVRGDRQSFRLLLFVRFAVMVSGLPVEVCFANIFPLKRDLPLFEREQTLIGDGDAMCVAAQIFEHWLRAAEGWFGVHHPIAPFHGVQVIVEETGILQMCDGAGEQQAFLIEDVFEGFEKEAAEEAGQHLHRQEEASLAARHEAFGIGGESAAGYDHVQVGMTAKQSSTGRPETVAAQRSRAAHLNSAHDVQFRQRQRMGRTV